MERKLKMKKYLIWGTGIVAEYRLFVFQQKQSLLNMEIVGFIDNNSEKWGKLFHEIIIYSPEEVSNLQYDYIDIWISRDKNEIYNQLLHLMKIDKKVIRNCLEEYSIDALKIFKEHLENRYRGNKEAEDFFEILNKKDQLSVYNYVPYNAQKEYMEVFNDEEKGLKYTFFEGKRMYLSRKYHSYIRKDEKLYVNDMWSEQDLNSPHLYIEGEVKVNEGDILIDAGVAEGNFSLHNIDKVKKLYIVECDEEWVEALRYTFAPWKNKVVICSKCLSNYDAEETITLDTLVKGEVNFIKMDIEGAEIDALNGAKRILNENRNLRCSICSYHRHGDEERIIEILKSNDMKTSTSRGYMLFIHDMDFFVNPELRRGIVRGIKNEPKCSDSALYI